MLRARALTPPPPSTPQGLSVRLVNNVSDTHAVRNIYALADALAVAVALFHRDGVAHAERHGDWLAYDCAVAILLRARVGDNVSVALADIDADGLVVGDANADQHAVRNRNAELRAFPRAPRVGDCIAVTLSDVNADKLVISVADADADANGDRDGELLRRRVGVRDARALARGPARFVERKRFAKRVGERGGERVGECGSERIAKRSGER